MHNDVTCNKCGKITNEDCPSCRLNKELADMEDVVQETKFQKGDKVSAFGLEGVVIEIITVNNFPVSVTWEGGDYGSTFTLDGKERAFHKTPSLKLISLAEKLKTVKVRKAYCESKTRLIESVYLYKEGEEFDSPSWKFVSWGPYFDIEMKDGR